MNVKKCILIAIGFICLVLGTIGVFLPILPTTPFYLGTLFCFVRSSERLHRWFVGTKLYQKHLDSFVQKKGMAAGTKACILASVTALMGIGIFLMARKGIWIPCTVLGVVWGLHVLYFLFRVKTLPKERDAV